MNVLRGFALMMLALLYVTGFSAVAQQDDNVPQIYASDMDARGWRVAIALADVVEIYDMRNPSREPRRLNISGVRALAFNTYTTNNYLAVGTRTHIQVIDLDGLSEVNRIEQPASALVWSYTPDRLIAGWERTITLFDARDEESSEPYPIVDTFDAYTTLEPGGEVEQRYTIRSVLYYEDDRTPMLLIGYEYDLDYGNHGETVLGSTQLNLRTGDMIEAPQYFLFQTQMVRELEQADYSQDLRYALIGNVWIDQVAGDVVILPPISGTR